MSEHLPHIEKAFENHDDLLEHVKPLPFEMDNNEMTGVIPDAYRPRPI